MLMKSKSRFSLEKLERALHVGDYRTNRISFLTNQANLKQQTENSGSNLLNTIVQALT